MDKLIHLILLSGLAFIPGTLEDNLALNGTVTQSSTHLTWLAQNGIDGKKYGSEFCFATSYQSNPWWRLDLLNVYNISTVIITTHASYLDHANGAEIRVGNSLEYNGNNNPVCAVTSGLQPGRTITYSCQGMLGRYVNVFMPGRTAHLSLCEVEVYGTENLALKGTVAQSSTYNNLVAEKSKDGFRYDGVTCSATGFEGNPWWRLNLSDVYNISTVIITPRSDCCSTETNGAEIRIGNSLVNNGNNNSICAVASDILFGQTISYSCHGMVGRYVNVVMTGQINCLSLCEVEVYGTENFAFKGTATQPSTYLTWIAQYAVDGVRYGSVEAEHCSSTSSDINPWWRLDLLDYYEIDKVIIAPKPTCCPEFTNGAEIRIGNSLVNNGNNNPICAVTSGIQPGVPISYSCGAMEGRYVNVVMTGRTTYLTICELEVYGKRHRKRTFLRLKMSSSGEVAAESDKILLQLQSALGLNTSDVKLSWTQRPEREEEEKETRGSCVKHL